MAKANTDKQQAVLLAALQTGATTKLEHLAADLMGRLLKVQIAVSKAGFQHGGDAGTAGRAGRRLRIECKRYADNRPLSDRELQGEIDDATRRTPGLEAWVLVSTRRVAENTQETLNLKAGEVGVPVIVVDWAAPPGTPPDLAALCAFAPDLVEIHYGAAAATAARCLKALSGPVVERIRHEIAAWNIGYKQLKRAGDRRLRRIWNSEVESQAAFAQNAAGGAAAYLITRTAVLQALHDWWKAPGPQPAVVFGIEGVGKTWAALQWVLRELRRLPLTLALPSSAFMAVRGFTETAVLDFLAGALYDVTSTQNERYWQQRLRNALKRPAEQGPVMLIVVDGMNQEPSFEWRRLVQILQGGSFRGRVRLILTTQTHFLEEHLLGMRTVAGGVTRIGVEPYDLTPGGEFDELLSRHGRARAGIPPELVALARVPRLFPLVMKLRSDVAMQGDATLPRLLWAYGRDELSMREGRAFSETEWEQWLLDLAAKHWDAIRSGAASSDPAQSYPLHELDAMVARRSLEPSIVARRLSEIVDGTWMEAVPGKPNTFRPRASTIHLALGAEVVSLLENAEHLGTERLEVVLARWLDPLGATSAAADVVAAAMSIAVAKRLPASSCILPVLVKALLQSQNVQDSHRLQAVALAPAIFRGLLETVEHSSSRSQASARRWALQALRGTPAVNMPAWNAINDKLVTWVAHVTCPTAEEVAQSDSSGKHQFDRLIERIGTGAAGVQPVMGVPVRVHLRETEDLADSVPGLLLGKPLVPAVRVLVAAAVTASISIGGRSAWEGFKWLVMLNPVDPDETVALLAGLADVALGTCGGPGVHPELPMRVAALLLWMAGDETHEHRANALRVSFEAGWDYDKHYLADPVRSWFALERRHLDLLWRDGTLPLLLRLQRGQAFLPDPSIGADKKFVQALETACDGFDISTLDTNISLTSEDHTFRDIEPGLARLAPRALAGLVRRRLCGLAVRIGEPRHWASVRAPRFVLLADAPAAAAAKALRLNPPVPPGSEEAFVQSQLLEIELPHAGAREQLDTLVEARDAHLTLKLLSFLQPTDAGTLANFLARWGMSNHRAVEVLLSYLAERGTHLADPEFQLLTPFALPGADARMRIVAFIALARSNPFEFGAYLVNWGWHVEASQTVFEQDHGSRAVLAVSSTRPLGELRFVVAPWCLLSEACARGGSPADAKVAAAALSTAINIVGLAAEHPGVDISVDLPYDSGSISFDPSDESAKDEEQSLRAALDFDELSRRRSMAHEQGHEYLTRTWNAGAVMAVRPVPLKEAQMLVRHCSAEVELWLDGHEAQTSAFRQRLNLAGGLYLALCEALLETDPPRGVAIWRSIEQSLQTRFVGLGDINDLMHMPFRVREHSAVLELRDDLYALRRNGSDKAYIELVLCASSNGCIEWLCRKISADETSGSRWRQKRAIVLRGLLSEGSAEAPRWREGPLVGLWEWLRHRSDDWSDRHAFARHWWKTFLLAPDAQTAYAAWHVFLLCVDRTALVWMQPELKASAQGDDLWRLKMLHLEVNRSQLDEAMRSKETKGSNDPERHLFGWDLPVAWFDADQLPE